MKVLDQQNIEQKISIKVCFLYGLYKQFLFIFLVIVILISSKFLQDYFLNQKLKTFLINFSTILNIFLIIRIIYGIIYFKRLEYILYKDRLVIKEGVFTNSLNFLELYRVKDYTVYQSFFMRLFNMMTIQLITSDRTTPTLNLKGVPKSDVFNLIRESVEEQRRIKGVREFD